MNKTPKRAVTGFGIILLLVLAFAIFFFLNFKTVVVSGHSMDPTFHTGQRVLASKAYWLVGAIKPKDVVVVRDNNPDGYIIKRVYKLGGETVDVVNTPRSWPLTNGPFVVPPNMLFILGDNREVSEDSRSFGPVEVTKVLGKVIVRK